MGSAGSNSKATGGKVVGASSGTGFQRPSLVVLNPETLQQ